jgi:hypothetical protein
MTSHTEHLRPGSGPNDAPNSEDMAIIAMLKAVWRQHKGDAGVVHAMREALSDGQVTAEEARIIEASAAFAVAKEAKNSQAFEQVENDPKLLEEAMHLKQIIDPECLAAVALENILKDGKVTRQEMQAFSKAYMSPNDKQKLRLASEAYQKREEAERAKTPVWRSAFALPLPMMKPPAPRPSNHSKEED